MIDSAEYFVEAVQNDSTVSIETVAHDGRHVELIAEEKSTETFKSFIDSLPYTLRTAISFDVNPNKLINEKTLSVYFTDLLDTEYVSLRLVSQEQLYEFLETKLADIHNYATQGNHQPSAADHPTLTKHSESKLTITFDLDSNLIRPNMFSQHHGNFPYCTSISLDSVNETLTYIFEQNHSTMDLTTPTQISDRILDDHFFMCPDCNTQSVFRYDSGIPHRYKLFTCNSCGNTLLLDDYRGTLNKYEYSSVTDALHNFIADVRTSSAVTNTTGTPPDYITEESLNEEMILKPEHMFTVDDTTYAVDITTTKNPIGADKRHISLREFDGPAIHTYTHGSWDDLDTNTDDITTNEDLFTNFCSLCTTNTFETHQAIMIKYEQSLPTTDYDLSGTNSAIPRKWYVCSECYQNLQNIVRTGVEKYSEDFIVEYI